MNKFRRAALLTLLALAAAPAVMAQASGNSVDVVKILSFSCSFCLASESHDRAITAATAATGGRYVSAPVPSLDQDTGARERLYYAARDTNAAMGERVKESLYKGAQGTEVPLYNFMQLYTWVLQDLPGDAPRVDELFKRAQGLDSEKALGRAVDLAINAGVQSLPTYILLVNGAIKLVLDRSTTSGDGLTSLRNAVISNIELLSKPNASNPPS